MKLTTDHQNYTNRDIKRIIKKEDIKWIRLEFIDVKGGVKKIEIPAYRIDTILAGKIMFDGSSIPGYSALQKSDLYLTPDKSTFLILPDTKIARIICDVKKTDGTPYMNDPRNVLRHELKTMRKMGFDTFNVGLEPEFFLLKSKNPSYALSNPESHLVPVDNASYFDIQPNESPAECRRMIAEVLMEMGLPIEAAHHEVADGQQEIDFRFSNALNTADNIELFKYIAKLVAYQNDYYVTFAPKPLKNENGSGMHINQSLMKNGKNVFYNPKSKDGLSKIAHDYILGLLQHAKALTALANATPDSYKRLIPGYEAPTYIAWGLHNRTALIRIPSDRGIATRCELRSADMTCNPYLILSAVLASGLDGIKHHLSETIWGEVHHSIEKNIFKMNQEELDKNCIDHLPTSLPQAQQELKNDTLLNKFILK